MNMARFRGVRPDFDQLWNGFHAVSIRFVGFRWGWARGAIFRIYHIGSLEVRTIEVAGKEEVGIVFSSCRSLSAWPLKTL